MKRPNIAMSSSTLALLVLAQIACGATRHVKPGQSIQAALDAAVNGDLIVVAPGTYRERIALRADIHLRGQGGPSVTTIDASSSPIRGPAVECRQEVTCEEECVAGPIPKAILEGFTITGGCGWGGGIFNEGGDLTIVNCIIRGNGGGCGYNGGGGLYSGGSIFNPGRVLVVNCAFFGNVAVWGGAVYNLASDAVMINCTFYGNSAHWAGGSGVALGGAIAATIDPDSPEDHLKLYNSIVWGNTPANDQIHDRAEGTNPPPSIEVFHCLVGGGYPGDMVLDADPLFVNAASGDFRLAAGSPAIDAGHNWLLPRDVTDTDRDWNRKELLARDLGGSARVMDDLGTAAWCGAVVDMGAFERSGTALDPVLLGDLNADRRVTYTDLLILVEDMGPADDLCNPADLNVDGMVDALDLDILMREMPSSGGTGPRRFE